MTIFALSESQAIEIAHPSSVGEARRAAADLSTSWGFDQTQQGNLAIVVTEAANNLAQHAQGGVLVLQSRRQDDITWMEVITIDKGPGMADVVRCLQDGYSTAGTAGQGLGAIARLADVFEIYSMPGIGTALLARLCAIRLKNPLPASRMEVGAISLPQPGQRECGDSWACRDQPERSIMMVADGLGHGPAASEASVEARRVFLENSSRDPAAILDAVHGALRKTRGAAVAIAAIDRSQRVIRFAGVGNIAGTIWSAGKTRSMVSHNGIVGHEIRRIQEFTYPFPQGSLLLMYSDGLTSHCRFDAWPGLMNRHPSLVASMIFRDCARGRDDATILVAREP